jgi:hypothetical protein
MRRGGALPSSMVAADVQLQEPPDINVFPVHETHPCYIRDGSQQESHTV